MEQEVQALLERGEGEEQIFLPARSRRALLGEALVALANTRGGYLVLGARRRRGRFEGVAEPEEACRALLDAARRCRPPLKLAPPAVVVVGGVPLVVAHVAADPAQVYHWEGRYLHRVGATTVPLEPAELRRLLLERSPEGFEGTVPPGATLDDLDEDAVRNGMVASGSASPDPSLWL
ncbi:MAG: helix-turn-helix domain-containing protein, partial [Chloroflexia bacterium]